MLPLQDGAREHVTKLLIILNTHQHSPALPTPAPQPTINPKKMPRFCTWEEHMLSIFSGR